VGSVAQGSGANCDIVQYCPHGNGTHTECLGHISPDHDSVNQVGLPAFMSAQLISLPVEQKDGDNMLLLASLKSLDLEKTAALIIRTLPNGDWKGTHQWSGNNPCYFEADILRFLRQCGYEHILTDLPSVDREEDGGALAGHHLWWDFPAHPRKNATITELIYVPDTCADGLYLLNLQLAPVEDDAAPSRPVIFPLKAQP
jgi:kynurenine formamidase